jgi:hypothetical protein
MHHELEPPERVPLLSVLIAMTNTRYIGIFFGLSALLLLIVGAVNVAVDPYAIFGTPLRQGWNQVKPEAGLWPAIHKPFSLWKQNADVLFLGSSRSAVGLNPQHPALNGLRAYNLALNGSNIQQIKAVFDHALLVHKPRRVIIGLDFFAFNQYHAGRTDFDPSLLASGTYADRWLSELKKLGFALGWQTLMSSMKTIQSQGKVEMPAWATDALGQTQPTYMEALIASRGGQRKAFLANEQSYVGGMYLPSPRRVYDLALQSDKSPMAELRHIVRASRAHGVELQLFISPVHARQLEVAWGLGLWSTAEEWKRALVRMLEEEARETAKQPFPLWDFSGYNSITTESVPPLEDSTARMKWYWESSHYRSETGDLVLNRIFGVGANPYADFGVMINHANLESYLAHVRTTRQTYVDKEVNDAAEITGLINGANKNRRMVGSR